ncbi:hypothetical protein CERSUDRAFT_116084 [Gelatoporia subvermispora B]|uniref:DUF6535 domain-containing protein n=1 Tax=Ceriporiopsis subvermispora (strain B) TaxID=914234 RepID=M2QDZ9_CERS8|nr:hypothetical protein CERSUDRAFT_116084 [Gelatoporia subvermispora B]
MTRSETPQATALNATGASAEDRRDPAADSPSSHTVPESGGDQTATPHVQEHSNAGMTWQEFAAKLRKQDQETAKTWKEEIDTLMNFAGLYSVILAAFNIELYKRLVPTESTSDPNTPALIYLISALNNVSMPSNLISPAPSVRPPTTAIWINALMFSSLVLGLSSAFVGLIIREWLNFFLSPHSGEGERSTYIHCLRWDRGVMKWRVPGILSALSIILQLALALFLSGLLLFLWTVERRVAIVTTSIVCALGAFWLFTTVAPAFSNWCPYKSPQALAFMWFLHWMESGMESFFGRAKDWDKFSNFHATNLEEESSAVSSLRKFDGSWGSIERYTFNSMLDGDRKHRGTLRWICDNVFALGHKLLMDDTLFSQFVRHCLHTTMADPILDNNDSSGDGWLPGTFNPQPKTEIAETKARIQTARSTLRRLRAIVQHGDPLSHAARNDIAASASTTLTTLMHLELDDETDSHIQFLTPHICAGGPEPMSVVLRYLGDKAKGMADDKRTRALTTMSSKFVEGLLNYAYPWRIWAPDKLNLDEVGEEYASSLVAFIYENILNGGLTPPRNASRANLLHLYNACCLAMLLAASVDPATSLPMLPAFVGHLKYFYDRRNDGPTDTSLVRWLARAYEMLRYINLS